IRIAASGRSSRTRCTRAISVATSGSATLTLTADTSPNLASTVSTSSGSTAGTVALTGTLSRSGFGQPCQPASIVADNQVAASSGPYSRIGEDSVQTLRPLCLMTSLT